MDQEERTRIGDLVVRLADGDRRAFDPLYDVLRPKVRRFAERAVGVAEAEDVTQAVMLKVFERASSFEAGRDAVAWILGIAAFECRTARTRVRRRREDDLVAAPLETLLFRGSDPLAVALSHDVEDAFRETFGELTSADRETLTCVARGERPELPPATFRKRVERAFARFRRAWGDRER